MVGPSQRVLISISRGYITITDNYKAKFCKIFASASRPETRQKLFSGRACVAEEVEKVNPDLVARDAEGSLTLFATMLYTRCCSMNFKEHKKLEEQECKIEQQDAKIARQQKQIKTLTAGLQKVNALLEVMKPTPQTVSR